MDLFITLNEYHNRTVKENKKEVKLVLYQCALMFADGKTELYNFVSDIEDFINQIKKYSTYKVDINKVREMWNNQIKGE